MSTPYQAKYFAAELLRRFASDSHEKLARTLLDAQVDLNPHQVDAALFAFHSPLSMGAILADEVGLGKTIEAGLVISQKWAERKRKILIIVPSSLRKQWQQELVDKFFIRSAILDSTTFKRAEKNGSRNPFSTHEPVICSYQFARNKSIYIEAVKWDLVVIDEAHRLRNVYRTDNKIARQLKQTLSGFPKILLTATPLQNSLLELYGLVSFIDDYAFGDMKSFRSQYARLDDESAFSQLKERLRPVCKRTLRRQVLEYIRYTSRQPVTQQFTPSDKEAILYDRVSDYLRRDQLAALPASQRTLMTLVLRKLLASSTFAIAGALDSLIRKLQARLKRNEKAAAEANAAMAEDFEILEELRDEWEDGEEVKDGPLTQEEIAAIEAEIADLAAFRDLAVSITENAKGLSLLAALKIGFEKARELGAAEKAIIFTESRRTQDYLLRLLGQTEYAGKIVLFNGSNNDQKSKEIYAAWKAKNKDTDRATGSRSADIRAALVDYFRDEAQIMIATEAAAEGINLQFCSLVVNYDLPWNPQRIEQRIGRCHRYGQKYDVVVVNFLNNSNAADKRVFELLEQKFRLFEGVFGASDEVIGSIESGVDFEKRIVEIYQNCRTPEEIQAAFDTLQKQLSEEIDENIRLTRRKLLENFDEEVHDKLRLNQRESELFLDRYQTMLWRLTRHALEPFADFDGDHYSFMLRKNPFVDLDIPAGPYEMGRAVEHAHIYRPGHPLADKLIGQAATRELTPACIVFDYSAHGKKVSVLEPFVGSGGVLEVNKLSVEALEAEDFIIFAGRTDDGRLLDEDICRRLLLLPGKVQSDDAGTGEAAGLDEVLDIEKQKKLKGVEGRNLKFFEEQVGKLDLWTEDLKKGLEQEIKDLDRDIRQVKRDSKLAPTLNEKLELQKEIKRMEQMRTQKRRELFDQQDKVDARRDELINELEGRLKQRMSCVALFTLRWRIV